MHRTKKSVISLIVVICFICCSFGSFANTTTETPKTETTAETPKTEILMDNNYLRIAKCENVISTLYKSTNTLEIKQGNNIISTIDLNKAEDQIKKDKPQFDTARLLVKQNTFSNYEYEKHTGNIWYIRKPKSSKYTNWIEKKRKETSRNRRNLDEYASHVEEINKKELLIIGMYGAGGLATCLTIIVACSGAGAPSAIASGLAAAGLFGSALTLSLELDKHDNRCAILWSRI